MEQKTVICPFCNSASKHGVRVCLPCGARISYGVAPKYAVNMALILAGVTSGAIGYYKHSMLAFAISFVILALFSFIFIRSLYKERVIFRR